jgi:hypothetical protein
LRHNRAQRERRPAVIANPEASNSAAPEIFGT